MKYILFLAFKNIVKGKRRTILTFLMLTFGVALYIFMAGIYAGFDVIFFNNAIYFETGHIKVLPASYDKETPYSLDNLLEDPEAIEKKLKEIKYIESYTQRIHFFGEIDNSIDSQPVVITGVDPQRDQSVFSLTEFITQGALKPEGAVIGAELAKDLGLALGDSFFITFRDKEGMYTSIETWISGLLNSTNPMANTGQVYLTLDFAKEWLGASGSSEIAIKTDDVDKAPDYAIELAAMLPDTKVKSWRDISSQLFAAAAQEKSMVQGVLFFILIIAMVGIVNTILISIYEKRREIGTLKAMGMLDHEVRNLFMAEGFFIGLLGSLSGVLLGSLIILPLSITGMDFTEMLGEMNGPAEMAMMGLIYPVFVVADSVVSIVLSVVASVLASYLPARRVNAMQPSECLRTVQ